MGNETPIDDYYSINAANEYTSVNRGGSGASVSHDAAGNMTAVPVIPGAGPAAGVQTTASITWDAFNRARGVVAEGNTTFAYCYDAFGRRIALWDAEAADNLMGRRYIWDGWSTIQERIFSNYLQETSPGSEEWIEMVPTESSAHSKAERVYVNGASIDEPLFVAIDGDLDGYLGAENGEDLSTINKPEYEKPEDEIQQVTGRNDFAYYYLNNRMGSITALLARDLEATTPLELSEESHESARILEYYRYSAYGSVTVLPVHDDGSDYSKVDTGGGTGVYHASGSDMGSGSRKAWDRVEDTPLDLADNNTIMLLRREADGTYSHLSARADYGRVSQFGNTFTFTARRQDAHTGLMYYRYRMYEPVTGRFVGRDPAGYLETGNLYSSFGGMATNSRDPHGLVRRGEPLPAGQGLCPCPWREKILNYKGLPQSAWWKFNIGDIGLRANFWSTWANSAQFIFNDAISQIDDCTCLSSLRIFAHGRLNEVLLSNAIRQDNLTVPWVNSNIDLVKLLGTKMCPWGDIQLSACNVSNPRKDRRLAPYLAELTRVLVMSHDNLFWGLNRPNVHDRPKGTGLQNQNPDAPSFECAPRKCCGVTSSMTWDHSAFPERCSWM